MVRPTLAHNAFAFVSTFAVAIATVAFIILSIFAILLLIPASPFDDRHITLGTILLVLDTIPTAILFSWIFRTFYSPYWHHPHDHLLTAPLTTSAVTTNAQNAPLRNV